MKPILRWVGGKGRNIKQFKKFYPLNVKDHLYIELFFGSGAFYFDIKPKYAIINDINPHLMNMYRQVKENPIVLLSELKIHQEFDSKDHFDHVKKLYNGMDQWIYNESWNGYNAHELDRIQMAGYLIYLNSRCFNGLYRENSRGEFNVAYDPKKKIKLSSFKPIIERRSEFFNRNTIYILNGSYERIIEFLEKPYTKAELIIKEPTQENLQYYKIRKLVYQLSLFRRKSVLNQVFFMLDPPYYPLNAKPSFTGYHAITWKDKNFVKLKQFIEKIHQEGFKFMLCNSDTDFINELFGEFHIYKHKVSRRVSCKANERKPVHEVVITNYKISTLFDFI